MIEKMLSDKTTGERRELSYIAKCDNCGEVFETSYNFHITMTQDAHPEDFCSPDCEEEFLEEDN